MKTYSIIFNSNTDCRTVCKSVNWKTALNIYTDTKNHNRFFQWELSIIEKNSGVVSLISDFTGVTIYENICKQLK